MTRRLLAAAALAVLWTGAAHAAPDCSDPQTQMDMNQCAAADLEAADGELQTAYDRLVSRLSKEDKAALRTAERAWIGFRDAWCDFQAAGVEGGSMYPQVVASCLAEETRRQSARLSQQLDCEEGDVTCIPAQ